MKKVASKFLSHGGKVHIQFQIKEKDFDINPSIRKTAEKLKMLI
jgi:hypothetical protein